jgi:hypothetical protein
MKILLGNAEFGMTGAAIGLLRLGTHLVKSGHQVSALPGQEHKGPLLQDYRDAGIALIDRDRVAVENWQVVLCNGIMAAHLVLGCAPEVKTIWWIQEGEIGLDVAKQDARFAAAFSADRSLSLPHARDAATDICLISDGCPATPDHFGVSRLRSAGGR